MNEIRQVKSEIKLKEWAALIADCQASTQTVKSWCLEHDINPKSYYYWLKKVRLRTLSKMSNDHTEVSEYNTHSGGIGFKPLEITGPASATGTAVTIHLSNVTLDVAGGADRETIEAVLLALKTIC